MDARTSYIIAKAKQGFSPIEITLLLRHEGFRRIARTRVYQILYGESTVSDKLRNKILRKYPSCLACGSKEKLEIDHIKPRIEGGKTVESNLQVLCRSCNKKKNKKFLDYRKT